MKKPIYRAMRFKDIAGKKFTRLTAVWPSGKYKSAIVWLCVCDCGNLVHVKSTSLQERNSKSCGCLRIDSATHHGMVGTPEYRIFHQAKTRCSDPGHRAWKNYGGRGIKFKFKSVNEMIAEIGLRPDQSFSIDRINNDGNYEPGNVRWATMQQQSLNKRRVTLTPERLKEALAMRSAGSTLKEIGHHFNVGERNIWHWLNRCRA
jgi:hypothetical protein